jgi:predicted nucleotidyltransferase
MQERISRLMRELKEALRQVYGENLRAVYLFGSYARGQEDPESDVDVAIVLKDFTDYWQEVQRTGAIIAALALKYGVSVSPVRVREADWLQGDAPFLNGLRKDCVLV